MGFTLKTPKKVQHNDNFVYLDSQTKLEAIKGFGYLSKIAESRNGNQYYRINPLINAVFMHIANNYNVVMNEVITCKVTGDVISLVPILSQMPFYISNVGNNHIRDRVKTSVDYNGYKTTDFLERKIVSLSQYGNLEKLAKDMHVHHEFCTFDHMIEVIDYKPRSEHNDRKSHIKGITINNIAEFVNFMKILIKFTSEISGVDIRRPGWWK